MTKAEIEAALKAAFGQCEAAGSPLDAQQKQILLAAVMGMGEVDSDALDPPEPLETANPLDELTPEQRKAFLEFIQQQDQRGRSWKVHLLNDWLEGRESGSIQFIRDLYGPQWLETIQPYHIAQYAEMAMSLKVGDRIEVSNNLWEWVQENGPCSREWFPCTVVSISQNTEPSSTVPASYQTYTNCMIRFDNGLEYEIQGVYEWNRYNWRWEEAG